MDSVDDSFADLIRRIRQGDGDAAAELVRQYEPEIRRAVRVRLGDPRLHRVLDSVDICQSVLANFFVRAAAGQFELDRPEQALKLLVTMAKNRLLDHARREQSQRRGARKVHGADSEIMGLIPAAGPTPSQAVMGKDLLARIHAQLTDEERRLAEERALGKDWAEIAAAVGGTAEALRKKLTRALDRAAQNLGLDADE
jgi:RNA polymerase sigma factor (sigma-70 family)